MATSAATVNAQANSGLTPTIGVTPTVQSIMPDMSGILSRMQEITQYNNAVSAREAATQRAWQEQQNKIAMDFNAAEAAKNRDWQAYMSNTAHQREVQDLMAAGLNPILSASGGNGAAVTSGATASGVTSAGAKGEADTSMNAALVNILSAALTAQNQMAMANTNAVNNMAIADASNAVAQIVSSISAGATRYAADSSKSASMYGSDTSVYLAKHYPTTPTQAAAGLVGNALGTTKNKNGLGGALNDMLNDLFVGAANLAVSAKDKVKKWSSNSRPTGYK